MKKIFSAILLMAFISSNMAYAQTSGYTWATGDPAPVIDLEYDPTYSVSRTDPNPDGSHNIKIKTSSSSQGLGPFDNIKSKVESGSLAISKATAELVSLLLYGVETNADNTDKMSALGTLDIIFANNLLTKEQEETLVLKPLISAIGNGGNSEVWAAVTMGLLANYFPSPEFFIPGQQKKMVVMPANYNPRDPKYRTYTEDLFEKYILDGNANIETRLHMAEGIGFLKSSVGDIDRYIGVLGDTLSFSGYEDNNNSAVIFSLCRALAYQATVYEDSLARSTLKKYYAGIESKDNINNPYPWTINIYSAMAASGYGIESAYQPLKVFAMWGYLDVSLSSLGGILDMGEVKAVPYSVRRMALWALPKYEQHKLKQEYPGGIETVPSTEWEDGKLISVDVPRYTATEDLVTGTIGAVTGAANFIIGILCWEALGATALYAAFGADVAIANSIFAEGVGYMVASGSAGAKGIAEYEMFLIMNNAKYAITFAKTPVGIMFNKVGKGIKDILVKFAPEIAVLKRGIVVTATVLNMSVATLTARTLPKIMSKAPIELVMSVADKEALATANTIIKGTSNASTMAENELISLLEKNGMDLVNAGKYVKAFKSTSPISIAPFTVTKVGSTFIQTTINVIFDGKENILLIQSDIPGDATFERVFKSQAGQVKSYSGMGGGDTPPVILSAAESTELEGLIREFDLNCAGIM